MQQAKRLKRVSAEHEEADLRPGPEFLAAESAKGFPEDRRHQERRHGEARRHEGESRGVLQGAGDHHESRAPEERTQGEGKVGFQPLAHV